MTTSADKPQRTVLITGANRGIGLETARQLARRGFHVIVAARDKASGRWAAAFRPLLPTLAVSYGYGDFGGGPIIFGKDKKGKDNPFNEFGSLFTPPVVQAACVRAVESRRDPCITRV